MADSHRHGSDGGRADTAAASPQFASLQDYVRLVRRHKFLILGMVIAFAAIAYALSQAQTPSYVARSSLTFNDVTQDLRLIEPGSAPVEAPFERASRQAQLVTRPAVTNRVARELEDDVPAASLAGAVSAEVSVGTNLVVIEGTWSDANTAALIANEYAEATRKVMTANERERLDGVSTSLRQELQDKRKQLSEGSFALESLQSRLSQVLALRDIVEPVEIAARATPPAEPVSPKPVRNALLAGIVGLVFGLLAAFVRDALDRRLRSVHDITEHLQLPILGKVSNTALGQAGLARNGRLPMAESDFEAFRVLRMNLGYLSSERPVRSLLVTSALPEEGKTTVSMSLASAVALAGERVLLVECDLRRPTFAARFGLPSAPGLAEYLRGEANPSDVLRVIQLEEPTPTTPLPGRQASDGAGSLVCIPAGQVTRSPAEVLTGTRFTTFLEKVTRAYDLVILDSSPMLSVVDPLQLVPLVDAVIVCARVQRTTRDEAQAARAALGHLPHRPMGAVATGLRRNDPEAYEYYYGY